MRVRLANWPIIAYDSVSTVLGAKSMGFRLTSRAEYHRDLMAKYSELIPAEFERYPSLELTEVPLAVFGVGLYIAMRVAV